MKISLIDKVCFVILVKIRKYLYRINVKINKKIDKLDEKYLCELFDWYYAIRRKFKRKKNDTSPKWKTTRNSNL